MLPASAAAQRTAPVCEVGSGRRCEVPRGKQPPVTTTAGRGMGLEGVGSQLREHSTP